MSDFDPDAYLTGASSVQSFDPDAYLAHAPTSTKKAQEDGDLFVDMGKAVAGGVVHAAGNLADIVTGTAPGPESHANRWAAPFAINDRLGQLDPDSARLHESVSNAYDRIAGTGPAATEIKTRIPQAIEGISTVVPAINAFKGGVAGITPSAQEIVDQSARSSNQSMGAASAAPRMTNVSPELQQAVVNTARATGGAVNPETLNRHIEADSLPIKIQLTPGQATQDPAIISNEMNNRARIPGFPDLLNKQNKDLGNNLQAIRDQIGPNVFTTNPVEHGDTLIEAYQAKDKAARAAIDAAYNNARQSISPRTPVLDARALYGRVNGTLEDKWATGPEDIMGRLKSLAGQGDASINAKQFEGLRTRLADLVRDGDGSTRYAAHLIRGVVEDSDLLPGTEAFKAPFDQARELARARFQSLEADPAYNAAVNETVSPDKFVQKFIIGAPRDDVATMRANLADNPTATQTMGVATLDHLRKMSDQNGTGNFSSANFGKHLQALDPKLGSLVDPATSENLEKLGNVARYTQYQPKGSYVNNSNTLVGALAGHAATAAENLINAKTGIGGTLIRKAIENRSTSKLSKETMAPFGGMNKLENKP